MRKKRDVTEQNSTALPILRQVAVLRAQIAAWRAEGARIGLVPTMGSLHRGHLALVQQALEAGEKAVVSIFVNPTQFGPKEDFSRYPRREAEDVAALRALGVDLIWARRSETVRITAGVSWFFLFTRRFRWAVKR